MDNPPAADRLIERLLERSRSLLDQPQKAPLRDDLSPGLRALPVGDHIVFYVERDEGIRIVRILHGRRDVRGQFS
ncbi:MAG: type II toxin-antitoxin system RelE/ParE family toxin [Caulobacteraceae bacterium]